MKETKFKQTEVGMIPWDWEKKKLGQLCSLWGRIGFRGYTRNDLVEPHKGAITFSPSDIHNQKICLSNCSYISLKKYEESPEIKVFNGDIIFGKTASIGKCALISGLTEKATINPQFVLLNNFRCDNAFLYYQLIDQKFQSNVWDICGGSTIPTMSQEKLKQQLIPIPPTIEEQQRIASALSDVDALISNLEKLIAKKKNIKQGAMQQLLTGRKRLPGFGPSCHPERSTKCAVEESSHFKMTELGPIPSDWEFVNIQKKCTIKARIGWQGLKSDEYQDSGDYVLITGTNFSNGFIDWSTCSYVSEWRFKQDKNIQIRKGDVLVTKDGTIGKIAFLDEIPMNGTLNSGVFVVRPKESREINSVYLSLVFKSIWFDSFLEEITSGSTIVHLYQKDFVKFDFPLPSYKEQTAIANVLSDMDSEIQTLETKLAKYRKLKTGMMQQLLTGKIRLID